MGMNAPEWIIEHLEVGYQGGSIEARVTLRLVGGTFEGTAGVDLQRFITEMERVAIVAAPLDAYTETPVRIKVAREFLVL